MFRINILHPCDQVATEHRFIFISGIEGAGRERALYINISFQVWLGLEQAQGTEVQGSAYAAIWNSVWSYGKHGVFEALQQAAMGRAAWIKEGKQWTSENQEMES